MNTTLRYLDVEGGWYTVKVDSVWDDTLRYATSAARNVRIEDCVLHGSASDVVKFTPGTHGATIVDNEIHSSGAAVDSDDVPWDYVNAQGIDMVNSHDAVVQDNRIHHIASTGVYIKGGSKDASITGNTIWEIKHSAIGLGQDTGPEWFDRGVPADQAYENIGGTAEGNTIYDVDGAGVLVQAAKDASILDNIMFNVARTHRGGVHIIKGEWSDLASSNVVIQHNVISVASTNDAGLVVGPDGDHVGRPILRIGEGGLAAGAWPSLGSNTYHVPEPDIQHTKEVNPYLMDERETETQYRYRNWLLMSSAWALGRNGSSLSDVGSIGSTDATFDPLA